MGLYQTNDESVINFIASRHSLEIQFADIWCSQVICDVSLGFYGRSIVHLALRQRIFEVLHNLSHLSDHWTKRTITKHFVWPQIAKIH